VAAAGKISAKDAEDFGSNPLVVMAGARSSWVPWGPSDATPILHHPDPKMKLLRTTLLSLFATGLLAAQDISPVLFGQNHWLAQGDEGRTGYLHLLWPQVKQSGVQLVRIGGNAYNVTPPSLARWTAMVDSVQAIGAEPLLQVPHTFTAAQATELVKHFNAPGRKPVRYWSIGNEPMLHDKLSLEEAHAYLARIAPALRAADPTIKILIFDEAWLRRPAFDELCGGKLDLTGKDSAGRWLIDGFTFHSYPNGEKFGRNDVIATGPQKIRQDAKTLVGLLEQANQKHGRTGDARLMWGLTEVNVTYANPDRDIEGNGNPSFLGGQFLAEIFGIGMEYGALTVAPWCISETDDPKTDFGFLGLPPDFSPRSSYYHTQLMARYLKGRCLKTSSKDPLVKIIGARTDKQIALLVMNQDQTTERVLKLDLTLGDAALSADAGLKKSLEVKIPSQTSQVYVLDAKGRVIEKITYGIQHNLRNLPPQTERY